MTRARRRWETNPHTGTCDMCGQALGNERLVKHNDRWMHRACWTSEKGE